MKNWLSRCNQNKSKIVALHITHLVCSLLFLVTIFSHLNFSSCALFHMKTRVSLRYFVSYCKSKGRSFPWASFSVGNILLSKLLRAFCFPSRSLIALLKFNACCSFFSRIFGFVDSLKISISSFKLICFSSAPSRLIIPL